MTCRTQASPPTDFTKYRANLHHAVDIRPAKRSHPSPLWFDIGVLILSLSLIVGFIWALMLVAGGAA